MSNINKRRGTLIRLDQEEFEDTKGVIRIRKSKNGRHYNGKKKKDKQQSTKHTHNTKERRTPLKNKTRLVTEYFDSVLI